MEVRDERTRFARNLDVHSIALHVSDDEQDETGIGTCDAPGGHKTRFNHQSRHNGATTCNVSLPQGGYTATRLVVPQLDLVVVPPIRPSAYL
jgi:hypothetical protein